MELTEKTLSSEKIFDGKILHIRRDVVRLPNGQEAIREVVDHPGGVCVLALMWIARRFPAMPLAGQAALGAAFITAAEFAVGMVVNLWLGWDVWDYSHEFADVLGQICPLYAGLWCLLAGPVIVGFDWLDYWLCGGERPRYNLL